MAVSTSNVALPVEMMVGIFSYLPPQEGKSVCRVCKDWKEIWEKHRYHTPLREIEVCKGKIQGKTLFECCTSFSIEPISFSGEESYPDMLRSLQKVHYAVRVMLSFLPAKEKKEIEMYGAKKTEPKSVWETILSFVPWVGTRSEDAQKLDVWQIAENPACLSLLCEKATARRDLFRFFRKNVKGHDIPPGEKVEEILAWMNKHAWVVKSLGPFDGELTAIPAEVTFCTKLETLTLSNNRITFLCSQLGKLESLQDLNLERNELTTFLDDCTSLKGLRALHLGNNRLKDLPSSMKDLHLLFLDISFNPFERFPKVLFEMPTLSRLRVCGELLEKFKKDFDRLKEKNKDPQLRIEKITVE